MGQCRGLAAAVSFLLIAAITSAEGVGDAAARAKALRAMQPIACEQRAHAQLLTAPMPKFPSGAASGVVDLEASVAADGKVSRVIIKETNADPGLVAAARQSTLERQYCPAYKNGVSIETRVPIRFVFRAPVVVRK